MIMYIIIKYVYKKLYFISYSSLWYVLGSETINFQDHIDYVNIGTPLSNQHYLGAPQGEIYGLDHTRERFSAWANAVLRPKTDIPGEVFFFSSSFFSCA